MVTSDDLGHVLVAFPVCAVMDRKRQDKSATGEQEDAFTMTDTTSLSQGVARQMPGQVRRISICVLHVFDRDWLTAAFNLATAAMARGVSTLSWVTIVPSTSEIRAEIFAGFGRGLTANLLRL